MLSFVVEFVALALFICGGFAAVDGLLDQPDDRDAGEKIVWGVSVMVVAAIVMGMVAEVSL